MMTHPLPKLEYPLPTKPTPDTSTKTTTLDSMFWYSVVEAIGPNPKIDFEILAALCRYKNANTARTMFFIKRKQMKQQLGLAGPGKVKGVGETAVKKERDMSETAVKKEKGAFVKIEPGSAKRVKREIKEEVE